MQNLLVLKLFTVLNRLKLYRFRLGSLLLLHYVIRSIGRGVDAYRLGVVSERNFVFFLRYYLCCECLFHIDPQLLFYFSPTLALILILFFTLLSCCVLIHTADELFLAYHIVPTNHLEIRWVGLIAQEPVSRHGECHHVAL